MTDSNKKSIENYVEWLKHRNTFDKKTIIVVNKFVFPDCFNRSFSCPDIAYISISATLDCAENFFNDLNEADHYLPYSDNVLNLNFDDVTEDIQNTGDNGRLYTYKAMTKIIATRVINFIEKNKNKHLLIHCRAGKSRSQGIARAIYDLYPDNYMVCEYNKLNPCETPNYDVVTKLKNAYREYMERKEENTPKIFFTSDLHISHRNILKHSPKRLESKVFEDGDIEGHDEWIIDTWNKTVRKKDIVYILGDFSFASSETIKKKILPRLNGRKFLILGNHDKSSEKLEGYFEQITQIKEVTFKKTIYPFIEEQEGFRVFMCHYPMVSWNGKPYGVVNLHGHCHGRIDKYNKENTDLRVDVGLDSELGGLGLVSLEKVYKHFKEKTEGKPLRDYAQEKQREVISRNEVNLF